jgi:hypothetical protein
MRWPAAIISAGFAFFSPVCLGQTTPPDENITELEKMTVNGIPVDESILPTVRPVGSVLGDDENVLDIPRSVTTVDKAWMEDREVTDTMDFGQFSPGVYSPAKYGVPASPEIRGDVAPIYVDGQSALYTAAAILPSFNGVEAMDIVKGPGSAVYGPQPGGPGGYANFVMKQPYFDGQHTIIESTLGYWTSGRSYGNPDFTIDNGGPITDKLAYRVSYLSRYGDGYYENEKYQTQDVFAALAYRPAPGVKFDWWAQIYGNRFDSVQGANRPTQQFIWDGTYIGGSVIAPPDSYAGGIVDGSFGVLNPATAYVTKLPIWKAMIAPNDSAHTDRFQTQLTSTIDLGSDGKIVNRTYFEFAHDREFDPYGYDEWMPVDESAQDRLEYHQKFNVDGIGNTLITGGDFRYTRVLAYDDYAVEPYFYYDLAKSASLIEYPAYAAEGDTFGGGYAIPGAPGYSSYLGSSDNNDSHLFDTAAFVQDTVDLTKQVSAVVGLRGDELVGEDASPSLTDVFNSNTGQIISPGIPVLRGQLFNVSESVFDPSYFISLIYKPNERSSFYVTYDRVDALLVGSGFGGIAVTYGANTTQQGYQQQIDRDLTTISTLSEAGYKQSFLDNTTYVELSVYQQVKTTPQEVGPAYLVKSQGVELESVYQPTKALSLNANFTYQNVTDFGGSFYQQTYNYLDGYPSSIIVDGHPGTGAGSPNFSASPANNYAGSYAPPDSRMRSPGMPQMLANFFVQYEFASGFGFGAGPQIQGWQYANDQDTLHIPTEAQWNGFVFYHGKRWDVRVNVKNFTNQRILDTVEVAFTGNDVIYIRPPISASITLRYHF